MAKKTTALQVIDKAEVPVATEVLDALVTDIGGLVREAPLQLAYSIGKLIVERLYRGNLAAWHDRGVKDVSLRKLAEHPGLETAGISPPVLYRSVGIYELAERHGGVSIWKHLGVSHLRAVLSLPEPQQQKLLSSAEDRRWTVEKIETEAAKVRKKTSRSTGGRPPLPQFVKALHHLSKYTTGEDLLLVDLDQAGSIDAESRRKLEEIIATLQERLQKVRKRLSTLNSQTG